MGEDVKERNELGFWNAPVVYSIGVEIEVLKIM
jgi:hypothetical protein